MLNKLISGDRNYASPDDLKEERALAKRDAAQFLQMHWLPVFIDEIQYVPELLSYIKNVIDNGVTPGSFWITGSQVFHLMELAQELLA